MRAPPRTQKRSFGSRMKDAKGIGGYSKEKTSIGTHLALVRDLREKDGHGGHGFWLDFKVLAGIHPEIDPRTDPDSRVFNKKHTGKEPRKVKPTAIGFEGGIGVYPGNAKGGGRTTAAMAEAAEYNKIRLMVGAALGLSRAQAELISDEVYDEVVACPDQPGGLKESPLAGQRLVIIHCEAHVNGKGEDTSFYEVEEYDADQFPEFHEAAKPYGKALPAAIQKLLELDEGDESAEDAGVTTTFEDWAAGEGWVERDDAPGWFVYNGDYDKQMDADDLRGLYDEVKA